MATDITYLVLQREGTNEPELEMFKGREDSILGKYMVIRTEGQPPVKIFKQEWEKIQEFFDKNLNYP